MLEEETKNTSESKKETLIDRLNTFSYLCIMSLITISIIVLTEGSLIYLFSYMLKQKITYVTCLYISIIFTLINKTPFGITLDPIANSYMYRMKVYGLLLLTGIISLFT